MRLCTLYYPGVWELTFVICGGRGVEFRVLNILHFNEQHSLNDAVNHSRDALYCISTAMWYIRVLCNKTVIGHWSSFNHFCGCIPVIDSSQIYCGWWFLLNRHSFTVIQSRFTNFDIVDTHSCAFVRIYRLGGLGVDFCYMWGQRESSSEFWISSFQWTTLSQQCC